MSFNELSKDISQESGNDVEKIYEAVDKYCSKYGVDRALVLSIIKQESNFNPNAVSYAGAKGLMQLMDFNSEAYGVTNPFDINQNVEAGVRHIKEYLDMFGGNLEMALMAYNGGPGTMERRGVKSPSDLYKMPQETQNYVPKILDNYRHYSSNE
ncbi:transglycosylase SLT domain-containing protein [Clostridium perfringens]|uniref:Transglycosylase SLT domain-containing protein n=2 Tax=Clostridium perfringens TaxID=1502 RepID=A0AAW9KG88_CLOPF|nr:transglycosylase SLT domain-containing protein [Clostridium perfringens]